MSDDLGTLPWLERTHGHLDRRERGYLLRGIFPMIRDGFRLYGAAKRSRRRDPALAPFEPPDTPMVHAARAHITARCCPAMVNHVHRTAFWTLVVLGQHHEITPALVETTWVAALLHDLGLEAPAVAGDFSMAGVQVLQALAHEHRWADAQTHDAGQAIALNLTSRANPARHGTLAWAMNVAGAGELGIWPHRALLARPRRRELEQRFPRGDFRQVALRLIHEEVARVPDGRFALFRPIYWLLMR